MALTHKRKVLDAAIAWVRTTYDLPAPDYALTATIQAAHPTEWDVHVVVCSGAFVAVQVQHDGQVRPAPAQVRTALSGV